MALMIKTVDFISSVYRTDQMPKHRRPEIVFFGRSNAGKSSLINCLTGRKIAKTSQTPGKTQCLNYFLINNRLYFVDAPGVGFARVSKELQNDWMTLMNNWADMPCSSRLAIHIIDSRHVPQEKDIRLALWLQQKGLTGILVLNKTDLLSNHEKTNILTLKKSFNIYYRTMVPFSAKKGTGKSELLIAIEAFLSHANLNDNLDKSFLSKGA